MRDQKPGIYILSDQKIRGEVIRNMLKHSFTEVYNVSLIGSESYENISSAEDKTVIIIDFIALNNTPKAIIKLLLKSREDAILIALHFYRNTTLVKPLFDLGIKGYVTSEPSRDELVTAVQTVLNDKEYIPSFLTDQ